MFTFPFLFVSIISAILILGWWTLVESGKNNRVSFRPIQNDFKKPNDFIVEVADELNPIIQIDEQTQEIEIKEVEAKPNHLAESREEFTLQQHLEKIKGTENQIISDLIIDLQNQFVCIMMNLKEINELIQIVEFYSIIDIQMKNVENEIFFECGGSKDLVANEQ